MYKLVDSGILHINGEKYVSCEIRFQDINSQITYKNPHLLIQNQPYDFEIKYIYIKNNKKVGYIFTQNEIAVFEIGFNQFLNSIWGKKILRYDNGNGYAYPMRSCYGNVLQMKILRSDNIESMYFTLTLNAYD